MVRTTKRKKKELSLEEKLAQALVPPEQQPYPVPENWCWVILGGITDVIGGGTPSSKVSEYYENGDIPWISPADLSNYSDMYISNGAKNITALGLEKSSARLLPPNTVCLSSRAPIGYVVIAANLISTNQGFKSFLPSPAYIPEYLYWYLKGNKEMLESKASGTTFLELSGSKASKIEFPLSPLAEQQRIVDRVESLFAKLEAAREKAQSVVDGYEDRRAAILHKAFTGELTEQWREEKGQSIDNWQTVTVGEISDVKGGKRVPKGMKLTDVNTGHPYIKAGNLKQGTVIDNGIAYVPDDVLPFIKKYTVEAGDVYITNVGACIGDCGVIPPQFHGANLTENAVKITNLNCISEYLARYLSSNKTQHFIKSLIASATLGKLSISNIKKIPILLPSEAEQVEIIEVLDDLLKKEQQAKAAAEQILSQIDTMKQSILARAFRGELGTNDPAEESAVELLKEVLKEEAIL